MTHIARNLKKAPIFLETSLLDPSSKRSTKAGVMEAAAYEGLLRPDEESHHAQLPRRPTWPAVGAGKKGDCYGLVRLTSLKGSEVWPLFLVVVFNLYNSLTSMPASWLALVRAQADSAELLRACCQRCLEELGKT